MNPSHWPDCEGLDWDNETANSIDEGRTGWKLELLFSFLMFRVKYVRSLPFSSSERSHIEVLLFLVMHLYKSLEDFRNFKLYNKCTAASKIIISVALTSIFIFVLLNLNKMKSEEIGGYQPNEWDKVRSKVWFIEDH